MLTDKQIKALKPKDGAYYESDDSGRRGYGRLAIKVTPSGAKSFYLMYRYDGKRKFLVLGDYPSLPLKTARQLAINYGQIVFDGRDPREYIEAKKHNDVQAKKEARQLELQGSVKQLFDLYIDHLKIKRSEKHYKSVKRALEKEGIPILGEDTKACDVETSDILKVLRPISARGSQVMTNRMRSYLSGAFGFGIKFDYSPSRKETDPLFNLKYNPVTPVTWDASAEHVSDRVLDEDEIKQFWGLIEASKIAPERKIMLKLMITLAGKRVTEVVEMPWSEIDLKNGVWDRPASRDKTHRHTLTPLGRMSTELLTELKLHTGGKKYLFGNKPPSTDAVHQMVTRLIEGKMDKFSPKCLRATAKTLLAKIGVSKEIRDIYHNHALQDVSGKHYDKWHYVPQQRELVRLWEAFLTDVLAGEKHIPGLKVVK